MSLASALSATLALLIPQAASAAPLWPDAPHSPGASIAFDLFVVVFAVGVLALFAYVLSLRSAARSDVDPDAPAAADSGAKTAAASGAILFLVVAILGAFTFAQSSSADRSKAPSGEYLNFFKVSTFSQPGLKVVHVVKAPKGPAYSIRVNAQQFLWRYEYPGLKSPWNTYSYHDLVLPAGITVMLDFTSSDAEAAWWVPQLGGSFSAVPGYSNKVWVRADKPGVYFGAGTIVNGTNFANMTTTVNVVPAQIFSRWVVGKQMEIDNAMTALGLERTSGQEESLITGQEGAAAGTAKSEAQQTDAADKEGKN